MTEKNVQNAAAEDLLKALQAFEGTGDGVPGSCPYPVNTPMIHHWCDAIGDRNPAYLDEDFARSQLPHLFKQKKPCYEIYLCLASLFNL